MSKFNQKIHVNIMFGKRQSMNLEIYMKSGNMIELDCVETYEFKNNLEGMKMFALRQHKYAKKKLLVGTIDLSQVESIVVIH